MLVHPAEARRQFREYAAGEITNENLAWGALLIALEDNPRIDPHHYLNELDALALRAQKRCARDEPPIFRLGHLHAEVFDEARYRGDTTNYYDPRNAYLHEVMERKVGLPITLSIIFLHVAEKLGLAASGVGLPGHFVVKVQFELNEVYVDPFNEGSMITMAEIEKLLHQISDGTIQLTSDHLRAWSGRQTLHRVLGNLQSMWTRAGDPKKAAAARERMEILGA